MYKNLENQLQLYKTFETFQIYLRSLYKEQKCKNYNDHHHFTIWVSMPCEVLNFLFSSSFTFLTLNVKKKYLVLKSTRFTLLMGCLIIPICLNFVVSLRIMIWGTIHYLLVRNTTGNSERISLEKRYSSATFIGKEKKKLLMSTIKTHIVSGLLLNVIG